MQEVAITMCGSHRVLLGLQQMTLTGPDRDEVFNWDSSEPELMKDMILAGVQIQMPIGKDKNGKDVFPQKNEVARE